MMAGTAVRYVLIAVGVIIAYEIVRGLVLSMLKSRLSRSAREYIQSNRVRLDKYKFMNRVVIKHELMNDPDINREIIAHAGEKDTSIREVRNRVEDYIEEIVPFFNLLSYYKIGYWFANFLLNLIYEVVIDHENAEKLKKIPDNSVVVFVMNHRSNIDYILVAYMLARQISLSYAVGEWARVWPLEYIFKSFGAYFIRRQYRERLYHLVLEKYIQLISLQGVTQGIFIEGGLTRDGRFRKAKVGILDYIIRIRKNPDFTGELVFVPASINYDWVLEDNVLVQEWQKGRKKSGPIEKAGSLFRITVRGPVMVMRNITRYFTGRLKHHGYASVSFSDPVFLSDLLKKEKTDIFRMERYDRLSRVQGFADSLLHSIGQVIPVTPVCLLSFVLAKAGAGELQRNIILTELARVRGILRERGCRIVTGKAFEPGKSSMDRLENEKSTRKKELVSFEEEFLGSEEAAEIMSIGMDLLKRRRIITVRGDLVVINKKKRPLLEYYAHSVEHLVPQSGGH